jgi:pimeloyl-ACP methyl ester carboxylesterase
MPERTVGANGIEVWCEDFGSPRDPALLLVMGAGGQGILWPDEFCAGLASGGRYVIRYDNRDTGQSTCVDFARSPYTLADMARDAIGLLDALGIERAHVAGASMGGMIAQTLAIEHGDRVRTLTSIMSSPLGRSGMEAILDPARATLPGPAPKVMEVLQASAQSPPRTRDERIAQALRLWRALAGSGEPFDEAAVREREARVFARARNPDAAQNHQLAIGASPDRTEALRGVTTPTLVIHGAEDPILPLAHGRATADAIPGAKLLVIEGMGHDLPPRAAKRIAQAILEHTAAV